MDLALNNQKFIWPNTTPNKVKELYAYLSVLLFTHR